MYKNFKPYKKGFVALISVILVSAILLALLLSTDLSSFYARFDTLDAEHYLEAQNLAGVCAQEALLRLAQNYNYMPVAGGDSVSVASATCTILSVSLPDINNDRVISISANQGDSYVKASVTVNVKNPSTSAGSPNISLISWQEQ